MNIEIRVYKRYDTDLLSLHDAGYSITKMMQEAVSSYANGQPCHFFVDEMVPFDMNDKKSVRLRLKFKDNDYNTINLIKNVKHGYRSNFCKQVLRNALIQQNLLCYMSSPSTFQMHDTNAKFLKMQAFQNLKMASVYRREIQHTNILGKEIIVTHEKGYKYKENQNTFDLQSQPILQQMLLQMQQQMQKEQQMYPQMQASPMEATAPPMNMYVQQMQQIPQNMQPPQNMQIPQVPQMQQSMQRQNIPQPMEYGQIQMPGGYQNQNMMNSNWGLTPSIPAQSSPNLNLTHPIQPPYMKQESNILPVQEGNIPEENSDQIIESELVSENDNAPQFIDDPQTMALFDRL